MKVYTCSEKGRRDYQQDRFLVDGNLFVIADGMGGHANGELAAEAVIDSFKDFDFESTKMSSCIGYADYLCSLSGDERGSTATAVYIDGDKLHVAHAGDSRAMVLRHKDYELVCLTTDHGAGAYLSNAVGFLTHVDSFNVPIDTGDIILLTTDGVHDYLDNIKDVISEAQENGWNIAEHLVHKALGNRSMDNCTAVVVEL